MMNARILAVQLSELRNECEMPLWEFAEYLGISSNYLSQLENGKKGFFTINVFKKLAEIVKFVLRKDIRLVFHFPNGQKLGMDEATEWIYTTRKENNQSQTEYSVKKGLAPGAITRLERGQIKSLKTLSEIAKAHGAILELDYETD